MKQHDWVAWHDAYDRPGSSLARRLEVVRDAVRAGLDALPTGPASVLSLCAGDGRDLLPVLAAHPRRDDVRGLLVERDEALVERAREAADGLHLAQVDVTAGDAGGVDGYLDRLPADLLLLCGVFGNVPADDVKRTVAALPGMLAPGGLVIWTRGRGGDGAEPAQVIRRWMLAAGLEQVGFTVPDDARFRVGAHRRPVTGEPGLPPATGTLLFTFG